MRRHHATTTTDGPRSPAPAAIMRTIAAIVAVGLLTVACADGESASSDTQIATPSSDQPASSDTSDTTSLSAVATDVAYDEQSDEQVLDVHVPVGDGPFPTVLAIHGGGFFTGSKGDYERHVEQFVDDGIAFVPIDYRLTPATTHPGQVDDVHCALAWVHENASRYRLDPAHIVVMGGSAGGYLAGMLAVADDRDRYLTGCPHDLPDDPLAGSIPLYGFYALTDLDDSVYPPGLMGGVSRLTGEPYNELTRDVLVEMSPIEQIDGSEPPILAIHGTLDRNVPSVTSERFVAALQAAGVDAELLLVEANHAFDMQPLTFPPNEEVLAAIKQFVADVG